MGGGISAQPCFELPSCSGIAEPDIVIDAYRGSDIPLEVVFSITNPTCPETPNEIYSTVTHFFSATAPRDSLLVSPDNQQQEAITVSSLAMATGAPIYYFSARRRWIIHPTELRDYFFTIQSEFYTDDCLASYEELIVKVRALNAFGMDAMTEERVKIFGAIVTFVAGLHKLSEFLQWLWKIRTPNLQDISKSTAQSALNKATSNREGKRSASKRRTR